MRAADAPLQGTASLDRIRAEASLPPPMAPPEVHGGTRDLKVFDAQHPDYLAVPVAPPEFLEEDQVAPTEFFDHEHGDAPSSWSKNSVGATWSSSRNSGGATGTAR